MPHPNGKGAFAKYERSIIQARTRERMAAARDRGRAHRQQLIAYFLTVSVRAKGQLVERFEAIEQ